jgi:adenylate cyclase
MRLHSCGCEGAPITLTQTTLGAEPAAAEQACPGRPGPTLDARLFGTRTGRILQEFLTNTAHYPLANIALVLVLKGTFDRAVGLDVVLMFVAAAIQAYALGRWDFEGRPHPVLGNLIGPIVFSALSLGLLGEGIVSEPNHLGYWAYSAVFGVLRGARLHLRGWLSEALIVLEAMARASIVLIMYWMFEVYLDRHYSTLSGFLSDYSHVYVSIVIPAFGLLLGAASVARLRSLDQLQQTAVRLRTLSEWSWGTRLVWTALAEPETLSLNRRTRVVLFMDIRGFTAWCDGHSLTDIATMLERYYSAAEEVWSRHRVLLAKLSADEIMLVVADAAESIRTAIDLRAKTEEALAAYGLSAGIGINGGVLIEGVIGSQQKKAYEVIGDPVNVASRICKGAQGGEILVSDTVLRDLNDPVDVERSFSITAKGKQGLVQVHTLRSHAAEARAKPEPPAAVSA